MICGNLIVLICTQMYFIFADLSYLTLETRYFNCLIVFLYLLAFQAVEMLLYSSKLGQIFNH